MAETLTMRVGESTQLRGPVGQIDGWRSSAPAVATVTDEDIVQGKGGGLVSALAPGRARITARGFDGAVLVDVEIAVEGASVVRVAAGESVAVPGGASGCTVENQQVARLLPSSELQGVGPGITQLRHGGTSRRVEVTGTLECEVESRVELRSRFAPAVRAWRSSSSEVTIDPAGVVSTGSRPRTVEVTADLEDGSSFTFDLRIGARRRTDAPARGTATAAQTPAAPLPPPRGPVTLQPASARSSPPVEETPAPDLSNPDDVAAEEVAVHLRFAEAAAGFNDWPTARAELSAAEIAASGRPVLQDQVRRGGAQLRARMASLGASGLGRAAAAILGDDFRAAESELAALPAVSEWRAVIQGMRSLCHELEGAAPDVPRVRRYIHDAWRAAASGAQFALLPVLTQLALNYGVPEVVPAVIGTLADPAANVPVAVREALEAHLREAGDESAIAALQILSDRATSPASCDALLALLPGLDLSRHGRAVVGAHAVLVPPARQLLASRLGPLISTSAGTLFDLLAGVVQTLPADPRLARAVQLAVGSAPLEAAAVKWASRGHAGARTVLRRLYDYPASAFPVR